MFYADKVTPFHTWIMSKAMLALMSLGLLLFCSVVSVSAVSPTFTNISPVTVWNVNEDAPVNYVIGTAAGMDSDGNYPLVFSVVNSGGGPFAIEPLQGSLRVNAAGTLNYSQARSYAVTLRVTDATMAYTEMTITVNVNDKNDPPVIAAINKDVIMKEEAPVGASVPFLFSASDANAGTTLLYFLIGADTAIFYIDQYSGEITLNTKVDVDPNPNKIYKPVLKVSDGMLSATTTLTVTIEDINDHSPECSPMIIYKSVVEGITGTLVALTCIDGDSAFNGNNILTYTISSGDSSRFNVSSAGVISVINAFDYEATTLALLNVKVEDSASSSVKLSTTVTVMVSIIAINDNVPIWSPYLLTNYTVNENLGAGTPVFTLLASDDDVDLGGSITYSITSVYDGSYPVVGTFAVDPTTGVVTALSKLDADMGVTQYTFDVRATDGGHGQHVISKTISVHLRDVNDNAPLFSGTPYAVVTLLEHNAKMGSLIKFVSAVDNDVTATSLTFSVDAVIQGNTDVSYWQFSTTSHGRLELAVDIDLDSGTSATSVLRLTVRDQGAPVLTATATLTVSITPDNEYPPTITVQPGTSVVKIAEGRPVGALVAEVTAADGDLGNEGMLSYSITAGDFGNAFSIDSSGRVTTRVVLDKETMVDYYQLVVKIQDTGLYPKTVTTTVTVSVTDVNDHHPSCSFLFKTITLPENTQKNSMVMYIPCSDADPDDNLTYSVKPLYDTTFGFTTPVNELKLLEAIDYDSPTQFFDVEVAVSDGVNLQTIKVRINVGAVNEDTPRFTTNPSISVTENVLYNPVITYTAVDTDYSPHDIVSYVIRSVTNGGSSLFFIDPSSGLIGLRTVLDYDSLPGTDKTFVLEVVAADGGGQQGTGTVTVSVVDVNDNGPVCSKSVFMETMNEKQVGTAPFPVVADLGCSDVENGTVLAYYLSQMPGSHFAVTSNRVELTADTLDYETATFHTLNIQVTDLGRPVKTTTIIVYVNVINLNEGGPVFSSLTPVSIDETIGAGQSVTDITATDPDESDPVFGDLQYSIIKGDSLGHFSINTRTGLISTRKNLDFESISSYSLVVQAKERGGANTATMTQIINLNDINDEYPVCYNSILSQTVPEDKPADYVVTDFSCVDKDSVTVLTYTITNGNTNLFKIDGAQLKLKAQLDYETNQSHGLTVTVSDSLPAHNVVITGTVNVGSVNEGPPVFNSDPFVVSVNEALAVSSVVLTVSAADPDSPLDENGQVKYSFVLDDSHFMIDHKSGQILLIQKLDRETAATHVLIVKAADASSFSTSTVSIIVLDNNDNTPKFTSASYSATVSASSTPGTSILTVAATDLDDPAASGYGTVSFALSGSGSFSINSATGVITSIASLSTSLGSNSYLLTVTAVDSGGQPGARTGSALVTIFITSINQYDPAFNPLVTSVTITEGQYSEGDIISTITVSDTDTGVNGDFDLTFVSPQSKFSLTQSAKLGHILLAQSLDFDRGDIAFTLEIRATDHGVLPRSSTGTILIVVSDVNDNTPLCPGVINVARVEGETIIANLVCSDADPGSVLSYMIISTTPSTISPKVSAGGVVTVAALALDYERSTSHQIVLLVQDDGTPTRNTTVTINLRVIDVNDNDPTLSGPFAFSISESEKADTTVLYKAVASGNDGPTDVITFSLSDTTYFDISPITGEISLTTDAPDYETLGGLYTMDVCAVDTQNPASRTACQTLTVTITDVNDMMPVFNPVVYSASVPESAVIGTTVPPVTAADADISLAYRSLVFSIVTGAAGAWRIANTGIISSIAALDYETRSSYVLAVRASDGLHEATVNYHIYVTPVNEFDPVFTPAAETVAVAENVALGTLLAISAVATDGDVGSDGALTYFIDTGPFTINSGTGTITVTGILDRELLSSYTVNIQAVDKGLIPRTGTLVLTVNIIDVNDMAPVCSSSMYTVSISENVSVGSSVISLLCHDDDDDPAGLNNALTYSIVSGDTTCFSIDTSGVLRNTVVFDRETNSSHWVLVRVSDKSATSKLHFTASVFVTIKDENDNPPVFTSLSSRDLGEDTLLGTTVATVAAVDADTGVNGQLQFQITNGNTGDKFYIDSTSGHIILQGGLDYESGSHTYNLEVTAMDKGLPVQSSVGTATFTVTDTNDNPPVCTRSLYTVTLPENSMNTLVAAVHCTDADTTGAVSYSITSGNNKGDFVIDSGAGTISTSNTAAISYEATQNYTLKILASDGVYNATTTVKITVADVNEFSPHFSPLSSVLVPEDVAIGYLVTTVSATDLDTFDRIKIYSIIAGNDDGKFMIDSLSGHIKVEESLDYETTQLYMLTLQVADSGGLTDNVIFSVAVKDLNDNSPVCTETSVAVNIQENVSTGSIYSPTCFDADTVASPVLSYSVMPGNHPAFGINSATGELFLVKALDYETATFHDLTVQVTDQALLTPRNITFKVTINVIPVNEYDPVFIPTSTYGPFSIPENVTSGTPVVQVSARDLDKGLKQGTVRYYMVAGDPQQQFSIDEATGQIKVIRALDREARADYSLTVRAFDEEPGSASQRSADATVPVVITDVNDHVPTFSPALYSVTVVENALYGPQVVLQTLTVSDDDIGVNGAMRISITGGNSQARFSISGIDLILSGPLDFETTTYYELILEVTDSGSPSLRSTGRVIVNVLPFNEKAPLMTTAVSVVTIPEDMPVGTLVFDANATDSDAGIDGQITYSITSGVTNDFVLDPITGQLFVGSELDYDTPPVTYSIIIQATDGSGLSDAATSTASLSIILQDINDHTPQFPVHMYTFSINENVAVGTVVGTVTATDYDSGKNGAVTYTKMAGNGFNYLNIESTTGLVTTTAIIDYETFQILFLSVQAQDGGTSQLKTMGLIKVEINNMNDNDPLVTPQDFAVLVPEDIPVGFIVFTCMATDKDTVIGAYLLASPSSYFQIDGSSGAVSTKVALDRELVARHILNIKVIDQQTSVDPMVRTVTATLTVLVEDINDNDPVITGIYKVSVPEDSSINTRVCTLTASDADANENAQLLYSISAGNIGNAFRIDSKGNLQVAAALDRENLAMYILGILVHDNGSPPRSSQVTVTVTIEDVNDNKPVFTQSSYTFSVPESSHIGTAVGALTATDADSGENGSLTYSIDSFLRGPSSHFTINGAVGTITVASPVIDREKLATYIIRIKVSDAGRPDSRVAFTDVAINIVDINDNPPVFDRTSFSGRIAENSPPAIFVLRVLATDQDEGNYAAVSYSIDTALMDGQIANTYFLVDATTGIISSKVSFDYENHKSFKFVVRATDGGSPPFTGTAYVTINVTDVNDNNPVFSPDFYNTEVAYSGNCQNIIITVTATDVDVGNNGLISYSLETAGYDYLFAVDSSSGQLSLRSVASADTVYVLDIGARDAGSPTLTAVTAARVRVDTYVANNHIVTFKLKISRAQFIARQEEFIASLQTVIRKVYHSGLVRLFCIEEYDGLAKTHYSGRRRLLAESPVKVHLYVLKDDSSNSASNLNLKKQFLTQDQFLAMVSANAQGDPGSSIKGAAWDYFGITKVSQYYEKTRQWFDRPYGIAITVAACLLTLFFLALLTFFIIRYCCHRKGQSEAKKKNHIVGVVPVTKMNSKQQALTYPYSTNEDTDGQPYRKAFPPMLITDPVSPSPSRNRSPSLTNINRSTNYLTTLDGGSTYYKNRINSRRFDGKAYNPASGKLFLNEHRWM